MAHHLDSPLARQDPRLDITDVYLFRGSMGTVFVMNIDPQSGGHGFHPEALYEFKIDTDDDTIEDITLRVTFGPPEPDGTQALELRRLDGVAARDRFAPGTLLAMGRTETEISGSGIHAWAGTAADPFFIDGTVLTAVKQAVMAGTPLDLTDFGTDLAANVFAGTNISSIVIEMPDWTLKSRSIGFWGVTVLATDAGGWRQINRCAQPLINTIFNPDDSEAANEYNANHPSEDRELHGPHVARLVAAAVRAQGSAEDPEDYGRQVRDTLLPDVLRYDIGTRANFGFARRNGRGLTESTPDIIYSIVLNTGVTQALPSSSASGAPRPTFPYVPAPLET